MQVLQLAEEASRTLVRELGDKIVAVALFGSLARGEASEKSDVDFFVVVRNFKNKDRRFKIYHHLQRVMRCGITMIDVEDEELFRENLTVNTLLLNIAWDSLILYDPNGRLRELFERIRRAASKELERYRTHDGKYGWKPRGKELRAIEV